MDSSKLGTIETIAILSIIMANKIILNLPQIIISSTGSSAWLNTIYIIFLALIFVLIVTKLLQSFNRKDILDISQYLGGKALQYIIGIIHILIFMAIITMILKNFTTTLKTIYFQHSPIIFVMLFFLVTASISNKFGIKPIAKVTLYIFPLACIGLIILLLSPASDFQIQRLLPIFGYGLDKTFIQGTMNIFALSGLGYIFLLPTLMNENTNLRKIALFSLGISGFFLLLSTFCLLLVFSFIINTNESMLLYVLTMFMRHGNLIHGINTLFVLVWILSIIAYISITFSFILFILKKIFNLKETDSSNYSICVIILGIAVILQNFTNLDKSFENIMRYIILIFVFIADPLVLIVANIKQKLSSSNSKRPILNRKECL